MSPTRLTCLAALFAALLLPVSAQAQSASVLIEQGIELRRQQRDEEALALFEQAFQAGQSGQALVQVALAEQALGRFVQAEVHLNTAIQGTGDAWVAERRGQLREALNQISAQLGTVELSGGVPGAEVYVDGQLRGTLPDAARIRARAGSVAVEIRAAGHLTVQRQVVVSAGGTARESIQLVATANAGGGQVQGQVQGGYQGQGQGQGQYQGQGQGQYQGGYQGGGMPINQGGRGTQVGTSPRWGLFGAGLGVFGASWVLTFGITLGVTSGEEGFCDEFFEECIDYGVIQGVSFVPLAGPLIIMAVAGDTFDDFGFSIALPFAIIDTLAQTAGAILMIIGAVTTVPVYAELEPGDDRSPRLTVLPWSDGQSAGLTATVQHF